MKNDDIKVNSKNVYYYIVWKIYKIWFFIWIRGLGKIFWNILYLKQIFINEGIYSYKVYLKVGW